MNKGSSPSLATYELLVIYKKIIDGINEISEDIPIVFPVHPRTKGRIEHYGFCLSNNIKVLKPLSFRESLYLWKDAVAVLTDSGGLQEEHCLGSTLRNTQRKYGKARNSRNRHKHHSGF